MEFWHVNQNFNIVKFCEITCWKFFNEEFLELSTYNIPKKQKM